MKERIGYIDGAKALAILLVILGHCPMDELGLWGKYLHRFVYSFHMPLFFIISGMFFRSGGTWSVAREKFRAFCLPYLLIGGVISLVELFRGGGASFLEAKEFQHTISPFPLFRVVGHSGSCCPYFGVFWR